LIGCCLVVFFLGIAPVERQIIGRESGWEIDPHFVQKRPEK
jgi:hypothetical protein